jgi:hypothetical protein
MIKVYVGVLCTNLSDHLTFNKDRCKKIGALCKSLNIVMNFIKALPGNSSVNTAQHATINDVVFSMSSVPRPVLLKDKSTRSLTRDTCFLCGLRHATIEGSCFLCMARAERI